MSATTGIEWTDATWNPVVGCTKVTQGCKNCYAKTIHDMRHKAHLEGKVVAPQYAQPFETVQLKPERLSHPLSWQKPRRVFVNSVSDLFHEDVPDAFIFDVWSTMAQAEQHTFQVLTKRPARMLQWFDEYVPEACSGEQPAEQWPLPNVWLGVSVENQAAADERIPLLLRTPAAVRFLSCEPLLERIDVRRYLEGWDSEAVHVCRGDDERCARQCPEEEQYQTARVDWVILGGESGKGARRFELNWGESLIDQGKAAGVPVFMKQIGAHVTLDGFPYSSGGHGGDMERWPNQFRVREFPASEVRA